MKTDLVHRNTLCLIIVKNSQHSPLIMQRFFFNPILLSGSNCQKFHSIWHLIAAQPIDRLLSFLYLLPASVWENHFRTLSLQQECFKFDLDIKTNLLHNWVPVTSAEIKRFIKELKPGFRQRHYYTQNIIK